MKKRPAIPEGDILTGLKKLLKLHPYVAWAARMNVAAGFLVPWPVMQEIIKALGGQEAFEARFGKQRWLEFGIPGMSDILGQMRDGRPLAIETKPGHYSPSAVTAEQRAFMLNVSRHLGLAFVGSDLARINDILSGRAEPESSGAGYMV